MTSLDPELVSSNRCKKLEISQAPYNLFRQFPQFEFIFKVIENAKIDKIVWKVIGGLPLIYNHIGLIILVKKGNEWID